MVVGEDAAICSHDIQVEVDQPLTADGAAGGTHAVRCVAGGTTEAVANVPVVLTPTGVLDDLVAQIMALAAQAVGSNHAQIGVGKEIGNQLTRTGGMAEFIATLQNVGPPGAMGTVGAGPAGFAIIVAIVAIGAEDLGAHGTALLDAIEVEHVGQQTGLWQRAAPGMHDGMAGGGRNRKLRNQVERIARRDRPHRGVSIDGERLFGRAGTVAAEAVLILIDSRGKRAGSVTGVDAGDVPLRDADQRRRWEYSDRLGPMRAVAVDARGVAVVVKQDVLVGIVLTGRAGHAGEGMPDLGRGVLRKHVGVGRHRRDVRAAVVAGNTILFILTAQQRRGPAGVVRRMAGDAGIGGHSGITAEEGLGRNLVAGGQGMHAGGPIGQRVDLSADLPAGIVAGQAQLTIGAVLHQKVLRYQVFGLHVRIVAGSAFDVAFDQLYRSGWVSGLAIGLERGDQAGIILQGQRQAERMRRLQVAGGVVELVRRAHLSVDGDGAIGHGLPDRHGAVMAAQAMIAVGAEGWLCALVLFGAAAIHRVDLGGELLVPEAGVESRVRRVAVGAGVGTGTGDGRFAARPQIMHAHDVAGNLRRQEGSGEQDCKPGQQYSEPHCNPSLGSVFKPTY